MTIGPHDTCAAVDHDSMRITEEVRAAMATKSTEFKDGGGEIYVPRTP